jgi:hypothetical protein
VVTIGTSAAASVGGDERIVANGTGSGAGVVGRDEQVVVVGEQFVAAAGDHHVDAGQFGGEVDVFEDALEVADQDDLVDALRVAACHLGLDRRGDGVDDDVAGARDARQRRGGGADDADALAPFAHDGALGDATPVDVGLEHGVRRRSRGSS